MIQRINRPTWDHTIVSTRVDGIPSSHSGLLLPQQVGNLAITVVLIVSPNSFTSLGHVPWKGKQGTYLKQCVTGKTKPEIKLRECQKFLYRKNKGFFSENPDKPVRCTCTPVLIHPETHHFPITSHIHVVLAQIHLQGHRRAGRIRTGSSSNPLGLRTLVFQLAWFPFPTLLR